MNKMVLLLAATLWLSPPAAADVLYDCGPLANGGDQVYRGFYIEGFNGVSLATVTLKYYALTAGSYTITLTAHDGTYDGALIGSVDVTFTEPGGTQVFDFQNAPVSAGATIAFAQTVVSQPEGSTIYYDTGPCADLECDSCPGIYETNDTTPPLSTLRRRGMGVTVTGQSNTPVDTESWGRMKAIYR
jgi:hypothetical protein